MYCPKCGEPYNKTDAFCKSCGQNLTLLNSTAQPQEEAQYLSPQPSKDPPGQGAVDPPKPTPQVINTSAPIVPTTPTQPSTPTEGIGSGQAAAFVPDIVPAETAPLHPGRAQGLIGIICAGISLLLFPPVFGVAGVILGAMALRKGEKTLGIIALVLSPIFMVIGMVLGVVFADTLKEGSGFLIGSILEFFR